MGCIPCSKKNKNNNLRMSKCPQKIKRLNDLKITAQNKAIKTDNETNKERLLQIANSISTSLEKQYYCPSLEEINNIKYAISKY